MEEPALLHTLNAPGAIECFVRIHDMNRMVGDVRGTSFEFGELGINSPVAVFWLGEFDPARNNTVPDNLPGTAWECLIRRGAILSLQDLNGQALVYEIDHLDPVHGATRNARLILKDSKFGLTYPAPTHTRLTPPEAI